MRRRLLDLICCPVCRAELTLAVSAERDDHVMEGELRCGCGRSYPVTGGVPRLLPNLSSDDLAALKQRTIEYFGYEWTEWGRYGWTDADRPADLERDVFLAKSLLQPAELAGRVALDAGCGNGRYTYWAADCGAEVVAVDLGPAVDSAFRNVGRRPNVHVIQGDLFRLPLRDGVLDIVFSIGVLMHTGDARRATEALVSLLKPGGSITVHLYAKGNPVYELNDALLRAVTTRLSIPTLQRLSDELSRLGVALERRHLLGYANLLLRLTTDTTGNFDWYAAPIATHHTYAEVFRWFDEMGVNAVSDNRTRWLGGIRADSLRSRIGRLAWRDWALTVRGRKSA
ncbi:MAG TPA: methyltransferase domain-containing protein [Kofleriaceae bacterium]|jgi:SAM-dependent methyltransferase|nr:methyltransferase domain-containing protein [Kofleriaceae bacterium]